MATGWAEAAARAREAAATARVTWDSAEGATAPGGRGGGGEGGGGDGGGDEEARAGEGGGGDGGCARLHSTVPMLSMFQTSVLFALEVATAAGRHRERDAVRVLRGARGATVAWGIGRLCDDEAAGRVVRPHQARSRRASPGT